MCVFFLMLLLSLRTSTVIIWIYLFVIFFLQNDDSLSIGEVTKADGRSATSYRTHAAHLRKD